MYVLEICMSVYDEIGDCKPLNISTLLLSPLPDCDARSTLYRRPVRSVEHHEHSDTFVALCLSGAEPINIDCITKKILLRSRQATSRPSPETSPVASPETTPFGSTEDLSGLAEKKTCGGDVDREIELQEIDPEKFLEFGSEIWR